MPRWGAIPSNDERVNVIGRINRTAVSANYTVTADDYLIAVTDTSVVRTITLPDASTVGAGRTYIIKDESGTAASFGGIIVQGPGIQLVDLRASMAINVNFASLSVYSSGTNWFVY